MTLLGVFVSAFVGRLGATEAACAVVMLSRPTPRARTLFVGSYLP